MAKNIEKILVMDCWNSGRPVPQTWDYVYTQDFDGESFDMYKCRCCSVGRYLKRNEKEV